MLDLLNQICIDKLINQSTQLKGEKEMETTIKKIGFEEVWASIHDLTQRQKETDRQMKENNRYLTNQFSELRESIKETGRQIQETDRQMKETDNHLREKFSDLKDYVGAIARNNGDFAETYFYETLSNTMKIGDLDFDFIEQNVKRINRRQNLAGEYDIILTNSDSIAMIEIKYKLHPNDIEKIVHKKIPVFKQLFPEKRL
ncbi:MAG: hypothetical protein OMM_04687 [Candidatus Magnetoglobus multicellularis str. Araruama]|uniref:DUF3782 domain-containing protein n=1 Tax=Candidatus Magnetoglobus multicellularis str. Araruama TaxID=890399 RepID=A0A1V1P068_9BACT|nr:MAG: hypothetical protein OMM_04687 [Candidatus Magnetoglobus multicellularis str. Araruama]